MRDYAIVCPGQGTQSPDMFDLVATHPRGLAVLQAFGAALGRDLVAEAQAGTGLHANAWAQPALVALARASWEILAPELPAAPAAFAGYSVGEVSAWSCAGAWDVAGSARLAATRAALMDAASPPGSGMLAVRGLPLRAIGEQADAAGLHVAIVNGDDHAVLAGPTAALDAAEAALAPRGAWLRRLEVQVPSHTPLLAAAAERFAAVVADVPARAPAAPVLRGIDGRRCFDAPGGLAALARAIAEPVRWADCMRELSESGVRVVLELGPGRSLAKLLAEAQPDIDVRSAADFRSWRGVADWLRARLDA